MARVDPPIDRWRDALTRPGAVVATGHQPFLWHPGILAKLLVIQAAAARFGCKALHLVVDQDVHDALTLQLPRLQGDRLHLDPVTLGRQLPDVPTGFHPPVTFDLSKVTHERIRLALQHAAGDTLAQQMTCALFALIEPVLGPIDVMYVSDLANDPRYEQLVSDMIDDAKNCAQAYNAALRQTAVRDIAPLLIDDDRVELPLWSCAWNLPRQRVFVRDADADGDAALLPKALALSAVMRSRFSDLFIHGLGGEIYDRATEAWWRNWTGQTLPPLAVATADLRLDFDVPVATPDELARAIWRRHHLRHNPDPSTKSPLLAALAAAATRAEKASIFRQLHALNDAALARDPALLAQADADVARARAGRANAAAAHKRDWCVGLYPIKQLIQLRQTLAAKNSPDR